MELSIFKTDGSEAERTVALDTSVFGIEPNDHAIWLDVRALQANARQGTHKTKERSEVRGGGAKPWRQKGTGRARVGTIRSPLWVGGGRTFGPRPHAYSVSVNKKTKRLARRSALSYRAQAEAIRVVEDFSLDVPKTKSLVDLLAALDLSEEKVLLLTGAPDVNLYKSGRNLPRVNVRDAGSASTFELMNAGVILLQESALDTLSRVLGSANAEAISEEPPAVGDFGLPDQPEEETMEDAE